MREGDCFVLYERGSMASIRSCKYMEISNLIEAAAKNRWDEARTWSWYNAQPWLVGCNFVPSGAINQLEMWQAETFDPVQIDRELGWLAGIGMNTVRVFLHDLLWKQDAKGYLSRIEHFLNIAGLHEIGVMFVFFDSCWYPYPKLGPQPAPRPHVHNSYWVQSPGADIERDPKLFDELEPYVTGVVSHFRNDPRVLIWDVWNEPENLSMGDTEKVTTQEQKNARVTPALAKAFQWVRSAQPLQPLTSGIWGGDWSSDEALIPLQKLQLHASDLISFHRYTPLDETRATVEPLKRFGRPLVCTEYMSRGTGNTFQTQLPYFKQEKIAAYNWGAVSGRTQTIYPWDSWQKTYTAEPELWFHDIFRPDGSPYDPSETAVIKSLTGR
jgi:hypothetical protein